MSNNLHNKTRLHLTFLRQSAACIPSLALHLCTTGVVVEQKRGYDTLLHSSFPTAKNPSLMSKCQDTCSKVKMSLQHTILMCDWDTSGTQVIW